MDERSQYPFDAAIQFLLRLVREHLSMDVAFISELGDTDRVFRYVDADSATGVEVGGSDPLEESYCHYVVTGQVPQLLRDPLAHEVTAALQVTATLPVGTHLSVPIQLADGTVYGTFCCFSHDTLDAVGERDLEVVRIISAIAAGYIENAEGERRRQDTRRRLIGSLDVGAGLELVFQPIVELQSGRAAGVEVLSRFPDLGQGPVEIFAEAWELGVGVELELKVVRAALAALDMVSDDAYMSVNVSADTLMHGDLIAAVGSAEPTRVVLELTEHAAVRDYEALGPAVTRLANLGVRLAVDDVGAGFSGLDHILRLEPAVLKLDGSLVRDVHRHPGKQAMIAALVTFAARTGATLVAEQIENQEELAALRVLGIGCGQGYHLGRPQPLPAG